MSETPAVQRMAKPAPQPASAPTWWVLVAHEAELDLARSGPREALKRARGWSNLAEEVDPGWLSALEGQVPDRFGGFSFGNEFCEYRLPTLPQFRRVVRAAQDWDLPFAFLTPYLDDPGLERLRPLLDHLATWAPESEVVVNDYGVLRMVAGYYPTLRPVLGRLLQKSLRDPRLSALEERGVASREGTRADWSPLTAALLREHRVRRLEVDALPVGGIPPAPDGFSLTLYLPYACIATSRSCFFAALHQDPTSKFAPAAPCRMECRAFGARLESPRAFLPPGMVFVQRGNTVLGRVSPERGAALLHQATEVGVDRVVFQAKAPF